MRVRFAHQAVVGIVLICQFSACLASETPDPNDSTKYLNAVREFADNVLKYGRDTYGPKHTPLFADGLNIHTHEPVKWISPKGNWYTATETEEWILSNFASQQTLLRTLDGLSTLTGDPKYRDVGMKAIKYAFENLISPNGLMYWGRMSAYDLQADKVKITNDHHTLKRCYPYYELMWKVDSEATKNLIEAFWSAHIWDWSNLDFNRVARYSDSLEEPWKHEYKRYPTFFSGRLGQFHTGTSLIHAGTTLHRLSGKQDSLIWSRRLIQRFSDARHPETGISPLFYNYYLRWILPNKSLAKNFTDRRTVVFPFHISEGLKEMQRMLYGESWLPDPVLATLLVGDSLGEEGNEYVLWALEELTAWGKASYRKTDNMFVPILTDGTNIEGVIFEESCGSGLKGDTVSGVFANPAYFWLYATAYRLTNDAFMWEMVRNIAIGNHLGDIDNLSGQELSIPIDIESSDPHVLLGFLELYEATKKNEFLLMARCIADNILKNRFNQGFFVLSKEHVYARFDSFEPLALLHLVAAIDDRKISVPTIWPTYALFSSHYRYKLYGSDRWHIYQRTDSPEVPWSLQDAAHIGDIDTIKTLLSSGIDVDSWDEHSEMTALQHAALTGHKAVAELLLAKGAEINYRALGFPLTPLSSAVQYGHKDVVELLLDHNVDVNLKDDWGRGQAPLDIAVAKNHIDIARLLIDNGAEVTTIHVAAMLGDRERVKAFLNQGIAVDLKDTNGRTPLYYGVLAGNAELVRFLAEQGADVNVQEQGSQATPLRHAVVRQDKDIVEILLVHGADIDISDRRGLTPLDLARRRGYAEIIELLTKAAEEQKNKKQ
jgi:pectate lyase